MKAVERPSTPPIVAEGGASLTWQSALIFAAIMAVGLALRLFRLDYAGHWHDEVITTFAARPPAGEIYSSISVNDTHPPGYHILLHYWGALFGYGLIPLRMFSVVTSLLCIPAVYFLGRALMGHKVGVLAAAMMAISPFQIFHGQQARMYPLLTLMVLLTTLAFVAAWRRGGAWRWALFGLAATLGLYTQVYFLFSLFALNLWAVYESVRLRRVDRARWAGFVGSQAVAGALFAPFFLSMFTIASGVVANFWIRTSTPLDWMFGLVALTNYSTRLVDEAPIWYLLAVYLPAIGAIVIALVYIQYQVRRRDPESSTWVLIVLAALTPCLAGNILSLTIRPIMIDRSLSGVTGPLYIMLAAVAVRTWSHRLTKVLAPAVILSMFAGLGTIYLAAPTPHTLQRATDLIFAERRPGDAVVVLDWQSFDLTALTHPEADAVYWATTPESVAPLQRRMRFMRWHTPENVGPLDSFAPRYKRIWITQTPYVYNYQWDAMEGWLEAHGRRVFERELDEAKVILYELHP
jgi:mannosyltransferase